MFYILKESYKEDCYTHAYIENINDVLDYKVTLCYPLGIDFPDLIIKVDSKNEPTDFFMSGPFLIISNKVKRVFEKYNAEIEYHDVSLFHFNKPYPINSFYFSHILCERDFLNRKKSIYKMYDEYFDKIDKLVVDESAISCLPIVILANSLERIILVKDDLVDEMKKENVTGAEFIQISQ